MRERPRYITDHPAMSLVAPTCVAVVVTLALVIATVARGETAGDYVAKARAAAAADEHRAAIRWYHMAIEDSPRLRVRLARELGHQYTWAESPDTAITWYRTYLNVYPNDMESHLGMARALSWDDRLGESLDYYRRLLPDAGEHTTEVRLGIARVLSWQDKLWPARREYEAILADDPDNLDARVGRARVINWAGRHREARGLFETLLEEHPENHEIRAGLANAHNWMGRPDRAMLVFEDGAEHPELVELMSDLRRARGPGVGYVYSYNQDSDDIERHIHNARAAISPAWLTRIDARAAFGMIEQPAWPDVSRNQYQLTLAQRLGDALSVTVSPGYETNEFDRDELGPEAFWQDEHDLFILDTYVTVTPADWVRGDVGVSRASLDNPVPIFRGIEVTETSVGLDWRLAPTVLTVTAASYTDYSDDNARFSASERVVWQPAERLPVRLRHRFTSNTGAAYFRFEETLDHGYYNPEQYVSLYQSLGVTVELGRRIRVEVAGRIAAERENTDDWFAAGSFTASTSAELAGGARLLAGYYNSRSRIDTRAGYEADGFWVGVER